MSDFNLRVENEIAILEFDQPDSKVNVLKSETIAEFAGIVERLSGELKDQVKALVIVSKKDGIFIAGANIKEIEGITTRDDAIQKADEGKEILDKLESLPQVTVAAINGACLGGGLELALACRHRVAGFSNKVKIGLPETKLGILPGFGGCVRLPKLVGLPRSLSMILPGKIIDSKSALRFGVVDRLFPDTILESEAIKFAKEVIEGKAKIKKRKKKFLDKFMEDNPLGRSLVFNQARKGVLKQTKGHYPAPLKAIEVIQKGYGKNLKTASRIESEGFGDLATTDVSKNLIKVFYLDESYRKKKWLETDIKPAKIKKCAVVGAGIMGGGIAQLLGHKNIPSRVKDINHDALGLALTTAEKVFKGAVKRKKLTKAEAAQKFNLISTTVTYDGFENADVVIEAVIEDLNIKKKVFEELDQKTGPNTLLLSNTSSLSVTAMGDATGRPDKVAGFHFFNPVHRMPLLEIITTDKTSNETLETAIAFGRQLGKMVIVVKDKEGFLVNRILLPFMNEAAYLFEEGFSMTELDKIAKRFGMPMGPMQLADEVGIDVGYKVAKILEETFGERMQVASILHEIKEMKMLGKKTGKGFYDYHGGKRVINEAVVKKVTAKRNYDTTNEMAIKRMIYIMINEASRILEEGIVDSPATIDVGMIYGTGFPPFRGGLMRYADSVGIKNIVDDLEIFEQKFSDIRFQPSNLLLQMAKENKKFYN